MNVQLQAPWDRGFIIGMLTGACVGAGLMLWLEPRMVTDMRQRVTDSVDDLTRKGQSIRDEVVDRVARGAHEVERYAMGAKTAPSQGKDQ